ncbi:uncharacterized protein LOC144860253 [Branchiostoma floridae x Branchiostoma japonicum]
MNKILGNSSACDLNKVILYQESLSEIVSFYEELNVCSAGFVKGLGDQAQVEEQVAEELEEDVKMVIEDERWDGQSGMDDDLRQEEEMFQQDQAMMEDEIKQIEQDEAEVRKEEEELKKEEEQNLDDPYLAEEEQELEMEEEDMKEQEKQIKMDEEEMKKEEKMEIEEERGEKDTAMVPEAECSLDVLRPCVDTFVTSVGSRDPWCDVMDAHLTCLQDAKKNCSFSAHIEAYRFGFMDMASAYVESGLCPSSTFNNLEEDRVFEQLEDTREGIYNPGDEEEEMEKERMEEEREMERERMEEEREMERERMEDEREMEREMMEEEREERVQERMMEEQRMSQEARMQNEEMMREESQQEYAERQQVTKQDNTGRSSGTSQSGSAALTLTVATTLATFTR